MCPNRKHLIYPLVCFISYLLPAVLEIWCEWEISSLWWISILFPRKAAAGNECLLGAWKGNLFSSKPMFFTVLPLQSFLLCSPAIKYWHICYHRGKSDWWKLNPKEVTSLWNNFRQMIVQLPCQCGRFKAEAFHNFHKINPRWYT